MSNNLLESLQEHLSGDVVTNLASLLGESTENTESALHTALLLLLSGLVDKSADPRNLNDLFNLLIKGSHDGGILSNLGALSGGGDETSAFVSEGGKLLASLFGDKATGLSDLVANASGISENASSSLFGFITPIIMGLIGKKLKIDNMENARGLGNLLSEQSSFLKNLVPAGLNNLFTGTTATPHEISDFDKAVSTLDFEYTAPQPEPIIEIENPEIHQPPPSGSHTTPKYGSLADTFDNIDDTIEDVTEKNLSAAKHMADNFGESTSEVGMHIVDEGKEFAHTVADVIEEGSGEDSKYLPWILIAAALALAWGLLKSCSIPETAPDTTASSASAPTTTSPLAEPVVAAPPMQPATPASTMPPANIETPAAEKAADTASAFFEKTLSTGFAIKAAKDGFESKLVGFIESNEAINKDLWFTLDAITFDTNKATIKAESNAQINHIGEILKAYPKVKIKIGGYTDNTGKAKTNQKLSDNRAKAVKQALVTQEIKAGRIDAEGYGSEHPVASNDTDEGRQKNRRIDVRVTEK